MQYCDSRSIFNNVTLTTDGGIGFVFFAEFNNYHCLKVNLAGEQLSRMYRKVSNTWDINHHVKQSPLSLPLHTRVSLSVRSCVRSRSKSLPNLLRVISSSKCSVKMRDRECLNHRSLINCLDYVFRNINLNLKSQNAFAYDCLESLDCSVKDSVEILLLDQTLFKQTKRLQFHKWRAFFVKIMKIMEKFALPPSR